jgi:hypothetical protein
MPQSRKWAETGWTWNGSEIGQIFNSNNLLTSLRIIRTTKLPFTTNRSVILAWFQDVCIGKLWKTRFPTIHFPWVPWFVKKCDGKLWKTWTSHDFNVHVRHSICHFYWWSIPSGAARLC